MPAFYCIQEKVFAVAAGLGLPFLGHGEQRPYRLIILMPMGRRGGRPYD